MLRSYEDAACTFLAVIGLCAVSYDRAKQGEPTASLNLQPGLELRGTCDDWNNIKNLHAFTH